jgi:hypothetical protein
LGKLGKKGCEVGALARRQVRLLVGQGDGRNLLVLGLHDVGGIDVGVVVKEERLHGVEGCLGSQRRRRLEGERILKPADLLGGKVKDEAARGAEIVAEDEVVVAGLLEYEGAEGINAAGAVELRQANVAKIDDGEALDSSGECRAADGALEDGWRSSRWERAHTDVRVGASTIDKGDQWLE